VMVNEDGTLDNDVVFDSITVASLLPGPVAVNVVTYIGYHLKGRAGAIISAVAVLLPACTLMLILSWVYFTYSYKIEWSQVMYFIGAAVSGIILSTALQLYKKEISGNYKKAILCFFTAAVVVLVNNYLLTIALILAGAVLGYFTERNNSRPALPSTGVTAKGKFNAMPGVLIGFLAINELFFLTNAYRNFNSSTLKIVIAFAGISLTLFGGGYVMIPLMQSLFVNDLHWLSSRQFIDAIAFSQATPGPILVSATFIGYKLAGIFGALIATIAMFAPSAILMVMVSKAFKKTKDHQLAKGIISWVKAVVIGLIIASAIKILYQQPLSVSIVLFALASLVLSFKFRISPVYLVIIFISAGVIKNFLI